MLARWNELSLRFMAGVAVFKARLTSEKGQTLVEYGLILALIAVAVVVILGTMGTNLNTLFTNISNDI